MASTDSVIIHALIYQQPIRNQSAYDAIHCKR